MSATPNTTIITIDGPAGTGKSSVSRRLADRVGARYLDTGAMYRVATLAALRAGADVTVEQEIIDAVADVVMTLSNDPSSHAVTLAGEDVSDEIRTDAVTQAVSAVSAVKAVREKMVALQRELVAGEFAVVEGRDIGTVVFPDATLKIYLTATAEARAERRHDQNLAQGRTSDLAGVLADVQRRDHLDSTREHSPLRPADDAVEVDTSNLDIDQVIDRLVELSNQRIGVLS
ncbi:(d)CMP kinase [Williamsia phyllosphaerae]|uniref:Cytidylate kinase n=1 Tax=Williamsia phyllosphaerae TaxID=885042 RepID=A0ABQ1VAB1_9NOCA|nr:(d)CMP kinase [Williamsia phyllosphaerae]GGF44224.1 cytidylate kinase [Williamsia phyllosphaerae]